MQRLMMGFAATLLVLMLSLSWLGGGQKPKEKPKLILVIAVDQMRFDYLTRFAALYKGGLRQLLDKGAVFSNANYRHANTETGPGHSVILSGRHASHSGIIANSWYDPFLNRSVNVIEDPVQLPLGGKGRSASPANFIGFTLGDVLKQNSRGSCVVGVALKDRSAILMAGRRADAAYWYEDARGHFITSTYYMSEAPAWLEKWNRQNRVDQYAGRDWKRLLEDLEVYEEYAGKDAIEGEWDRRDVIFPHVIRGKPPEKLFYDDFRRTPFADEVTLEVVLAAMEAHDLGVDEVTDILAIGFSATDVIGHTYGAFSQEVMDQMLRLDITLQKLFEEVQARVGLARTWVVLTSDHGSLPLVETLQSQGIDARRASPGVLETAVRQALQERFPEAKGLIAYYDAPHVYLDESIIQTNKLKRHEVESVISKALLSTGLVTKVYTQSQLLDKEWPDDPMLQLFQNSFYQPRSPHLIVCLNKYVYLDDRPGGTGHGTPYEYDRHVPIIFMGDVIKPGTYPEECGPEDIAPTLAQLLDLDFPKEKDSRLLSEMIR